MKRENILIIADMEGASGLTSEEQLENGEGVRALTLDLQAIIEPIRSSVDRLYIWDFDGDEHNLSDQFGPKTKVISHPTWQYLCSLDLTRVFLVGFHAMQGIQDEFCPHTYSGADIEKFLLNGQPVGEATLFTHLFSQCSVPVVFLTGSYYAGEELKSLGLRAETVAVRKDSTVYDILKVRKEMSLKAKLALQTEGKIVKLSQYEMDITFFHPSAHFFKNTHFIVESPHRIKGSANRFDLLYQDFVNGVFTSWDQTFRF